MFKKFMALVMALALLCAAAPFAFAEGEVITVEWLNNSWETGMEALIEDNFLEQYIRENLGVDIEYTKVDELETTLNMRMMAGDIPDIIKIPNRNYLVEYAQEGYLLNLDEYADQLSDAFAFTEGNRSMGKVDGATYAITGRPYGFRQSYWYNVNAFNAAGITEIPTTLDEYFDAVRTVMAADIDGNGVNDTLGITGAGWDTLCQIFGAHGVSAPNVLTLDAEGHVVDTMLTENFYDALVYANGLWEEGIIDPEIFSLNDTQVNDKGKIAQATTLYTQWPGIKKVANWESYLAVDPNAAWEQVGPLTGPDGVNNYAGWHNDNGYTSLYAVNADLADDPEKLEAVLKVVNFFGTEEGLSLTTHGIEGTHWDYNEEGAPVVRPECIAEINYSWVYQICGREELSYCRVKFGDYAWKYVVDSDAMPRLNNVTGLVDDPEWYNGTDAETYISEECAKFLTGERDLTPEEWQSFIDTLESTYNYSQFVAEYDAAWQAMVG
ncbi:MAG: extracellular solute-binding protein [Clostridiales bacterium]|nr:extracellular solute-binding protein [Clostridiales bacterium]